MINLFAQTQPDNVFTPNWWRGDVGYDTYGWQIMHPALLVTISAILTLGLYSLLYRENKFYRFVEHTFVGLAAGFSMYNRMVDGLRAMTAPTPAAYAESAAMIAEHGYSAAPPPGVPPTTPEPVATG